MRRFLGVLIIYLIITGVVALGLSTGPYPPSFPLALVLAGVSVAAVTVIALLFIFGLYLALGDK